MARNGKGVKRSALLAIVLGFAWLLSTILPAKALDCATSIDQECRLVFGTYCQVTHRNPCFP